MTKPSKTSKYRVFIKLHEGKPTVTDSYPLKDTLMPRIMNWHNERGN